MRMVPREETQVGVRLEEGVPFKKIMLALDLSERTPELIRIASRVAKAFNAEVIAVTVVKMPTSVRGDEFDGMPANEVEEKLRNSLAQLLQLWFDGNSKPVQTKVLHGEPAERICEHAEFLSVDLILLGSRGYGPFKRALLGSTSSAVAANSKKSVMILK